MVKKLKSILIKKFQNEQGFLFPLTCFIVLLLLLLTFHQIKQYETQRKISELNMEQYKLEMLYQKTYLSIREQESKPPYHFYFPDGNVYVTIAEGHPDHFQARLETDNGSYREITIKVDQ